MKERTQRLFWVVLSAALGTFAASCGKSGDEGSDDAYVLDAGAEDLGIDVNLFPPCEDNTDCSGGEICREGNCREACNEDDPCQGDLKECAPELEYCVECAQNAHCPGGHVCRDHTCRFFCADDADCTEGRHCTFDTGECADNECDVDRECSGGYHCRSHLCVPIDEIICAPNSRFCEGNVSVECSGDGTDAMRTSCSPMRCVQLNGEVACSEHLCEANGRGCLDEATAFRCNDTGDGLTDTTCEESRFCSAGECQAPVCEPNTTFCEGNYVVQCDSLGAPTTRTSCDTETNCIESELGCGCLEGGCAQRICQPGTARCAGDGYRPCAEDGLSYVGVTPCDQDEACISGSCLPESCEPGTTRCIGDTLVECLEGGSDWLSTICSASGAGCVPAADGATCESCPQAMARARIQGTEPWLIRLAPIPLQTLEFDGRGSTGVGIDIGSYDWSVVQRPDGSTAELTPNGNVPNPTFFVDLAGTYRFELQVRDAAGVESCEAAEITVIATPDEDIHIQLVWQTPGDPNELDTGGGTGSDLDLHFMHPNGDWDTSPWDCHWKNKTPNWGDSISRDDDPSLDIDDTDGAGPENINLNNPEGTAVEPVTYKVGVFYFSDHDYGAVDSTVRIFIEGTLSFESTFVSLADREFWDVARIEWPSGEIERTHIHFPSGFP